MKSADAETLVIGCKLKSFTGTAQTTQVEILLPNATPPGQTLLNGTAIVPVMQTVETSTYACFQVEGIGVHDILITLG